MIRRAIIAAALLASLLAPALAQAPPAVPALPDTERRMSYSISSSTCACSVGFALYGDSTDVDEWIEVWIGGVRYLSTDSNHGWSLSSNTGSLATIPRPITDAVLTFNTAQTGTVQIVGARRPRRPNQFTENRGVAARDLNQVITDLTAQNRETWDKINDVTGRGLFSQPGNSMATLPAPTSCINGYLNFGANGLSPTCISGNISATVSVPFTRSAIATSHIAPNTLISVAGYRAVNDLGYGAVYTSVGATSTGLMAIKDADGNWWNLVLRDRANIGWFGARGDNGATTISSGDITANPQWRGTYAAGTTWDTVGIQEAIYAAYAGASTPGNIVWNDVAQNSLPNFTVFTPESGVGFGINVQILSSIEFGAIEWASRAATWDWVGSTAETIMWLCDGCAYVSIIRPALQNEQAQNYSTSTFLWSLDWTGNLATALKTQQISIYDAYISIGNNGKGIVISRSGNGAQGDTVNFFNPVFIGNNSDTAISLGGENTLNIGIYGGDCQGFVHDCIANNGGQINVHNFHSENESLGTFTTGPLLTQLTTYGADFHIYAQVNGDTPSTITGWRAEDNILGTAVTANGIFSDLNNGFDVYSSAAIGVDAGQSWAASFAFQDGFTISAGTKGRNFMMVDNGGTDWLNITSGTSSTITDSTASYTTNQWVGYKVFLRFGSNGFFNSCPITANTATTITFSSCTFSTQSSYQIAGLTGSSPPSWDSAGKGGQAPFANSGQGFSTTANSNCIDGISAIFNTLNVGDYIVIPNASHVAPVGAKEWPNALYGKITTKQATACSGGAGSSVLVGKKAAFTLSQVAGYYGPAIADNNATWIDLEFDSIAAANIISDFTGPGLLLARGSVTGYQVHRSDWQDHNYDNNPATKNINFDWAARSGGQCATLSSASTPIDLTTTLQTCNTINLVPTQSLTLNAPVPDPYSSQEFILFITTSGTSPYTITFGSNFSSVGTLNTGTVNNAKLAILFRSNGDTGLWQEIVRAPISPGGSNTDVQFNNSGVFGGDGNFTYGGSGTGVTITGAAGSSALTLAGGTQTANIAALNITQTWNNSGTTFDAPIFLNVTNTASNSASLLADLQVGGVTTFKIGSSPGLGIISDGNGTLISQLLNNFITFKGAGGTVSLMMNMSSGLVQLPNITTDATHTDATVCEDTTSHALYFGSGTAGICLGTSSLAFKHDVAPLDVGLAELMRLQPISYKYNEGYGDPNKILYGFSMEQGRTALPKLASQYSFDYLGVVPVLVRAVQQQQQEIEALKHANDDADPLAIAN